MKTVEGSGGDLAAVKGRQGAPGTGRRRSGGMSVRRRVQVDAASAPEQAPLQRLLAACRRAFGCPGTVPAHDDVVLITGILDKMGGEDVHLRAVTKAAAASGTRTHPIITRTTIYNCKNFSIVIFLLPPGAVIPLHNHPEMTVFSKLLLGSLHVTSYDWVEAGDGPPPVAIGGDRRSDEVAGDDGVLRASASATDDEQKPRLGWLLETRKPKELHMYEVPYRGPPILLKKKRPAVECWQRAGP